LAHNYSSRLEEISLRVENYPDPDTEHMPHANQNQFCENDLSPNSFNLYSHNGKKNSTVVDVYTNFSCHNTIQEKTSKNQKRFRRSPNIARHCHRIDNVKSIIRDGSMSQFSFRISIGYRIAQ